MKTIKKRRKNSLTVRFAVLIFIFFFLLLGFTVKKSKSTRESPGIHKIKGPLNISGMNIFDATNTKVAIRGINFAELMPTDFVYVRPDISKLPEYCRYWVEPPSKFNAKQTADWGFNTVRIPIYWHTLEIKSPEIDKNGNWHHTFNEKYLEALDNLIKEISGENMAVVLDMHQYLWSPAFKNIQSEDGFGCSGGGTPDWLYPDASKITFQQARCDFFRGVKYKNSPINPQQGFIEVWKFLVKRYRDNPQVVAADIINEPWSAKDKCTAADLNLSDFYLKVGKELREINPNIILIFEDSQDNEDGIFSMSGDVPIDNWMYSFHLYTSDFETVAKKRLDKYYERARKWNVPLFLGEFDAFGKAVNSFPDPTLEWQEDTGKLMQYMKEKNINWTFWAYSGYYSLLQPNTYDAKEDLLKFLQTGF